MPFTSTETTELMRPLLITLAVLTVLSALFWLLFVDTAVYYEMDHPEPLTREIRRAVCFFDEDEKKLHITVVDCIDLGLNTCRDNREVIKSSIIIAPVLIETNDTLKFTRQGDYAKIYMCPTGDDCWSDKLRITILYQVDSLGSIDWYSAMPTFTRTKDYSFGFKYFPRLAH
jgi:hypothetical protein